MNAPDRAATGVSWRHAVAPRRVLAIRFQAFGDIIGTLPGLQGLRGQLPGARLDLLTRRDFRQIPDDLELFDRVFAIHGRRNRLLQTLSAASLLPLLKRQHYDVVLDLQNNRVSDFVRRRLACPAWSSFDRYSPQPHAERVRQAIRVAWPRQFELDYELRMREPSRGDFLIPDSLRDTELVVLNPAGYFVSRNWPIARYARFADLWLERRNGSAHFVVLGVSRVAAKARELQRLLPGRVLNLVGKTSPAEALGILQRVALVVSEDSGLMHMAWCSGRPTVALFGSSRSSWSRPLGEHTALLDSSDLTCGECMQAECRFGDVRCLTRYSAEQVLAVAEDLLKRLHGRGSAP